MKVSALIPTYNRRNHICRAIDSVLAQTLPIDEIVVVDDGSTDGTNEFLQQHYGDRIVVVRQENQGVGVARRRALLESRAQWVAFLDSDDEWLPERNAAFFRAATAMPENVAWIFGDTLFLTDDNPDGVSVFREHAVKVKPGGEILDRNFIGPAWFPGRPACSLIQSTFVRRSALLELGCFSEGLRHTEDFLATMQVASRYRFAAIPDPVTRLYRTSDLAHTSLEMTKLHSIHQYTARLLGAELAAKAAGRQPWGRHHEEMVRSICKVKAENHQSFRRFAFEQFKFGVSPKSVVFLAAAFCGPGMVRAALAAKRNLRALLL